MVIRRTEVDGVPAVVAQTTGPTRAGLMFRVGQADETLARRGITHLIEHLVLHPLGEADYHYNGTTGTTVTHFHLQGPVDAITAFLGGVCRSLRHLDAGRIDIEKSIVMTEEQGRATAPTDDLPLWRHGARDYGLTSFPQWGLHAVGPDELAEWVARYFTRGNAALWFAGEDLPAGLRLDLPDGTRHRVPAASSALPTTPAYFPGNSHATALDAVLRHRPAGPVLAGVLERRLFRALRQEAGLSYTAAAGYEARGDGYGVITALADALPGKQDAVLGGFLDVLAALRVGRIDEADVAAVVAKATDALSAADADAARLPGAAFHLLTGQPVEDSDQVAKELAAVDVEAVHAAAVEALDSALLMTPHGTTAQWAGFTAAPTGVTDPTSGTAVAGTAYPSAADPTDRLVVGPDGVSRVGSGGQSMTVRLDACAAVLAYPDGGRLAIGEDAVSVRIEPTLYPGVDIAALDARIPPGLRVDLPARDPHQIPSPVTANGAPSGASRRVDLRRRAVLGALVLVTAVMGGVALVVSIGMAVGAFPPRPLAAIGTWIVAGYLGRKLQQHWQDN